MKRTIHTHTTDIDISTTGHKDYMILAQNGVDDNQIVIRECDIPEIIRVLNSIHLVKLD